MKKLIPLFLGMIVTTGISHATVDCADVIKKKAVAKAKKTFVGGNCIAHEPKLGSQKPGEHGQSGTIEVICTRFVGRISKIRQPFQFDWKVSGTQSNNCETDVTVTDN